VELHSLDDHIIGFYIYEYIGRIKISGVPFAVFIPLHIRWYACVSDEGVISIDSSITDGYL